MKALVAVYSFTGNTLKVAEAIKNGLGADFTRIDVQKDVSYAVKNLGAILRRKAPIKPCQIDLKGYDLLVLCCPVWSFSPPPGVNEYVARLQNASGKRFAVVTTMGSSGAPYVIGRVRKKLSARGMQFVGSLSLLQADVESGSYRGQTVQFAASLKAKA